jgi:hypothetical protein
MNTGWVYQQNVLWYQEASGSVWELPDQNPTVVKFESYVDWCSERKVHMGAILSVNTTSGRVDRNLGSASLSNASR